MIQIDEGFGHRRTQSEYARDLGVSERTVRRWQDTLEEKGLL